MSRHKLDDTIALLSRTPATLNALLRDLPDSWTMHNEGGSTMTAFDVVGHLIQADLTNWIPRARHILEHGDRSAFGAFDRMAHIAASKGKSLPQLLDEFARVRAEKVDELRALKLQPEDLERRGKHPAIGATNLSELLAAWVAHDLTHLHQISRILAHQYRETVGSWSKFLGVMHCQGHGG